MGYLGRRIGKSQDTGNPSPDGNGGGLLDLISHGYFERQGKLTPANAPLGPGIEATGGVISEYVDSGFKYRAHVFTSSGTFNVTALAEGDLPNAVEYLVVAGGGGGGGGYYGGGGGAGGLRTNMSSVPISTNNPDVTVAIQPYSVTVGAGGFGGGSNGDTGPDAADGNPSSFNGPNISVIESLGGGGGRGRANGGYPGLPGGSGSGPSHGPPSPSGTAYGGYGYNPSTPAPVLNAAALPNPYNITQGNPGGDCPGDYYGGGGGGAGQQGSGINNDRPWPASYGYPGGGGMQVLIAGPANTGIGSTGPSSNYGYFAGGGAGGTGASPGSPDIHFMAKGGYGGGGNGANPQKVGSDGTAATGGGGGGGMSLMELHGGNGGGGIVAIRYKIEGFVGTAKATGGSISFYNGKVIHAFLNSGTFTVTDGGLTSVETIIVAGGGGGGGTKATGSYTAGGGGGAGGVYVNDAMPVSVGAGTYTVTIGGGGVGGKDDNDTAHLATPGLNGGQSSFNSITIDGGGGGGNGAVMGDPGSAGLTGASGGGDGGYHTEPSTVPGTGAPFPGALSNSPPTGFGHQSGSATGYNGGQAGGAGASGPGTSGGPIASLNAPTVADGRRAGTGIQLPTSFRDPASTIGAPGPTAGSGTGTDTSAKYYVGGGGGAGAYTTDGGGFGGFGGGGNGGFRIGPLPVASQVAQSGMPGTGGGGGGARIDNPNSGSGGSGGSGLVLIAYPI